MTLRYLESNATSLLSFSAAPTSLRSAKLTSDISRSSSMFLAHMAIQATSRSKTYRRHPLHAPLSRSQDGGVNNNSVRGSLSLSQQPQHRREVDGLSIQIAIPTASSNQLHALSYNLPKEAIRINDSHHTSSRSTNKSRQLHRASRHAQPCRLGISRRKRAISVLFGPSIPSRSPTSEKSSSFALVSS